MVPYRHLLLDPAEGWWLSPAWRALRNSPLLF